MSIFGKEFEQIWPKAGSTLNLTDFGKALLKQCENIKKPEAKEVDINEFKRKSSNFPLEFGTNTCRVMSQPKDRYPNIQKQIASAYPVIHERVLQLYLDFLEHKCQYGLPLEKQLYKNLPLTGLVQRLLAKRCVAFVGANDSYMLMTGETGEGNEYCKIGTDSEKSPLTLKNVISYDEVKLSAFLSVTSHTELINNGNRFNNGIIEQDLSKIEREGVVVGIIGARFEKPYVMEYQDILITKKQNIPERGYGYNLDSQALTNDVKNNAARLRLIEYRRLWQKFYESQDFCHSNIPNADPQRFSPIVTSNNIGDIFDNVIMKKRYAITFDTLLLESQSRARTLDKFAYIHIVGIGLGVWKVAEQQTNIFLECFTQRVKHLLPQLNNIGVLHFSYFHREQWQDLKHNGFIPSQCHPRGGIKTFLENRNPADKLQGKEYENMLLVISYAWDGNALSGNEFWFGSLSGSNDPSTACSTLITEIHNPHINNDYINGDNLHVACADYGGVMHISDYVKNISKKL